MPEFDKPKKKKNVDISREMPPVSRKKEQRQEKVWDREAPPKPNIVRNENIAADLKPKIEIKNQRLKHKPNTVNPPVSPARAAQAEERKRAEKELNKKYKKRRKKNYTIYYIMLTIVAIVLFCVLSVTVLFNISDINVEFTIGACSMEYDEKEIVDNSGISNGQNLVRLNTVDAERSIRDNLIYVDDVKVSKQFPSSVFIKVQLANPMAAVVYDNSYYIVSYSGKILSKVSSPNKEITVIYGFKSTVYDIGETIACDEDTEKLDVVIELMEAFKQAKIDKITSVNISDRLNISAVYDGRIELKIGSIVSINEKLKIAQKILDEEIGENEKGTLVLTSTDQVAFDPELKINAPETEKPEVSEGTDVSVVTDEYGNEVMVGTDENGNIVTGVSEDTSEPDTEIPEETAVSDTLN